jgi:phosphohistidine phosphatase
MGDQAGTRTLIVMRHAKAGELPGGPDFDRPLRPRGERDSAAAGRWLASKGLFPELVLCSAARRTLQTWQRMSKQLGGEPEFSAERRLYQADSDDLAELVRETNEQVSTLLYVGHNPAAAGLVALLTGTEPDFPTAAIAVIAIPAAWSGATPGTGRLVASWTPRPSAA